MSTENIEHDSLQNTSENLSSQEVQKLAEKTGKQVQEQLKTVLTQNDHLKDQFLLSGKMFLKDKNLDFILQMKDYREFTSLTPEQKVVYKMCYFLTGLQNGTTNPFLPACQDFIKSLSANSQASDSQDDSVNKINKTSDPNISNPPKSKPSDVPHSQVSADSNVPDSQHQDPSKKLDKNQDEDKLPYNESLLISDVQVMDGVYERTYADGSRDRRVGNRSPYQFKYKGRSGVDFSTVAGVPIVGGKEVPVKYVDHPFHKMISLKQLGLSKEQLSTPEASQKILDQLLSFVPQEYQSLKVRTWVKNGYRSLENEDKASNLKELPFKEALEKNIVPIIIEDLEHDQALIIPKPSISNSYTATRELPRARAESSGMVEGVNPVAFIRYYPKNDSELHIHFPIYRKRKSLLPSDDA